MSIEEIISIVNICITFALSLGALIFSIITWKRANKHEKEQNEYNKNNDNLNKELKIESNKSQAKIASALEKMATIQKNETVNEEKQEIIIDDFFNKNSESKNNAQNSQIIEISEEKNN